MTMTIDQPVTQPAAPPPETARARMRTWVRRQIDGKAEVYLPAVTKDAIAHFSTDQAFMADLLKEVARATVYDVAQSVLASTRTDGGRIVALGPNTLVTEGGLAARAGQLRTRWDRWLEHAGDRHVLLMDMTKDDLKAAIKERQARVDYESDVIRLWESLASKLKRGQKVRECFTVEQIESERQSLSDARQNGKVAI